MTPQEQARIDIQRAIETVFREAQIYGDPNDITGNAARATERILTMELLITDGKVRPIARIDYGKGTYDEEEWRVYVEYSSDED